MTLNPYYIYLRLNQEISLNDLDFYLKYHSSTGVFSHILLM